MELWGSIYSLSYLFKCREQALQSQLLALSNAGKYVQAAAQVTLATFPGKGKIYYSYLLLFVSLI